MSLEASNHFIEMIELGAVSLVRSKSIRHGVRAAAYVGNARLENGLVVNIAEKVPGTIRGLIEVALPAEFRDIEIPSSAGTGSSVLAAMASRFLAHLAEYLRRGRLKEYKQRLDASSVPRGRINLDKTASLFARGKIDQLAYWRNEMQADIEPNRLLALGLLAVDSISYGVSSGSELRARARKFAVLFEDAPPHDLAEAHWYERAAAFRSVIGDSRIEGDLRKALGYARAIVLHLGALEQQRGESRPHTFLVNLETLFEEACRSGFEQVLGNEHVRAGRIHQRRLFNNEVKRYLADPDIVVGDSGSAMLVGDCKYKGSR